MNNIQGLVESLAQTAATPNAYNPYAPNNPYNDLRRANLLRYLDDMFERKPSVMLVMEAPGYRGCRLTGIPVMSRKLLLAGVAQLGMFGAGYRDVPEPGFEHIQGEQTATIVWGTLAEIGQVPLIWSTFPFHPHQPEKFLSNRAPTKTEIALGLPFVRTMLEIFAPTQVIAVGRVGDTALRELGVEHLKIRHPSQGGKNDFVAGIRAALG